MPESISHSKRKQCAEDNVNRLTKEAVSIYHDAYAKSKHRRVCLGNSTRISHFGARAVNAWLWGLVAGGGFDGFFEVGKPRKENPKRRFTLSGATPASQVRTRASRPRARMPRVSLRAMLRAAYRTRETARA